MKKVSGIWLPDEEVQLQEHMARSAELGGKATYQLKKYVAAQPYIRAFRQAIDIGAHVGLWSRVMAVDFEHVTAFEPLARHAECFRANLAGAPNVSLVTTALGAARGPLRMSFKPEASFKAHVDAEGDSTVTSHRLDDFAFEAIDFIKIDVEGFELPVLQGGEEIIRRKRPTIIVEQKTGNAERHGFGRYDARDLLINWGMKQVWDIGSDILLKW